MSKEEKPRIVTLDPPQPCARCGLNATIGTVEPLPPAAADNAPGGLLLLPICQDCIEQMTRVRVVGGGTILCA